MTFLEKAMEINTHITDEKILIKGTCPCHFGLEDEFDCASTGGKTCIDCWNREMPNTEAKHTIVDSIKAFQKEFGVHSENAIDKVLEKELKKADYEQGMNDAWELAKKIWCGKDSENVEIFGTKFVYEIYQLSPQEALAKLKTYEEAQNRIEIGDVVKYGKTEYVVCSIFEDFSAHKPNYCGVDRKGRWLGENDVTKTGKHLDIKSILESIGE